MTELVIELNKNNAVINPDGTIDWIPALRAAALEVHQLDSFAVEGSAFPRPIGNNPDSLIPEGFLGAVNTPPSVDGMVTVRTEQYEWLNLKFLPAQPTTFSFILGQPPQTGGIA